MPIAAVFAAVMLQFAPEPDPGLSERAAALIDETGSPGGAVLVVEDDAARVGVAGVRIRGEEPAIEPGDLWHLGSNTKAMTATLAARLVEQGAIDWDATVGDVLGEAVETIEPAYREATLADLLAHRARLPANLGAVNMVRLAGSDAGRDAAADRRRYAAWVLAASPAAEEGEFLYSNAGYVVAGLMLETAAGEPYETLMRREVFDPLGMATAGWGPPGTRGEADQPRGHGSGLLGGLSPREPGARADNPPAMNSAGRAHMSLGDLGRFLAAHLDGARGDERYLSEESWRRLHAPAGESGYALGWSEGEDGGLEHAGSNTMWFVKMAVWPDAGRAAAVAINDGRIEEVADPVGRAVDEFAPD
ncbi:serine hydrolase domain-containing protein [Marinicauda salina]|nr:serine hydrolase domain-containing protein [Marinicauda salina]